MVIKDLLLMKYPVFIQFRFVGRKKNNWSNCVPGGKPRATPLVGLLGSSTLSQDGSLGEDNFGVCAEIMAVSSC